MAIRLRAIVEKKKGNLEASKVLNRLLTDLSFRTINDLITAAELEAGLPHPLPPRLRLLVQTTD